MKHSAIRRLITSATRRGHAGRIRSPVPQFGCVGNEVDVTTGMHVQHRVRQQPGPSSWRSPPGLSGHRRCPATISVCWRISGNSKMLAHTAAAEQLMEVSDAGAGHQLAVEQLIDNRRVGAGPPTVEVTGDRGGVLVVDNRRGVTIFGQHPWPGGRHQQPGRSTPGSTAGTGAGAGRRTAGPALLPRTLPARRPCRGYLPFQQSSQHRGQIRKPIGTEAYAYDAIDFALDAIEEAEYAVLDAMYARAAAAALGV